MQADGIYNADLRTVGMIQKPRAFQGVSMKTSNEENEAAEDDFYCVVLFTCSDHVINRLNVHVSRDGYYFYSAI